MNSTINSLERKKCPFCFKEDKTEEFILQYHKLLESRCHGLIFLYNSIAYPHIMLWAGGRMRRWVGGLVSG